MEKFKLYNRNSYLGLIGYDKDTDEYTFIKSNANEGFPPVFAEDPFTLSPKSNITSEDVKDFIEHRIPQSNNLGIKDFLDNIKVHDYYIWEIFIKTNGMTYSDDYWIDSNGVKSFDEHLRNTGELKYFKMLDKEKNIDGLSKLEVIKEMSYERKKETQLIENMLNDLRQIIRKEIRIVKPKQEKFKRTYMPLDIYISELSVLHINSKKINRTTDIVELASRYIIEKEEIKNKIKIKFY